MEKIQLTLMKPATLSLSILAVLASLCTASLRANPVPEIARTNENSLNDLIGRIAYLPIPSGREMRRLSAIQEQLILFEREMRGEGLPQKLADAFSIHYSSIISAIVDDRIDDARGRELLAAHRELLAEAQFWAYHPDRDENFEEDMVGIIWDLEEELEENSWSFAEVPYGIRTPLINGYQVWLGELLVWGHAFGGLSPGDLRAIEVQLSHLERFEGYYKRDGFLYPNELDMLHKRFLELTKKTIDRIVHY